MTNGWEWFIVGGSRVVCIGTEVIMEGREEDSVGVDCKGNVSRDEWDLR